MLSMTKEEDESWHDALMRLAAPWQLEHQVDALFQEFIDEGQSESEAAFSAAYELDILDCMEDEEPKANTPEEEEEDEDDDSVGIEVQEFFAWQDAKAGSGAQGS